MTTHKENNVNVDSVVQGHTPETEDASTACYKLSSYGDMFLHMTEHARALERDRNRLREALQTIAEELQQSNGGKGPTGGLTTHLHDLAKAALSGAE